MKTPGRKPKGPFAGKSTTFTSRITPGVRKRLQDAAKRAGRSFSQEIEYRLDRSLQQDHFDASFMGSDAELAKLFSDIIRSTEHIFHREKSFRDDPQMFATVEAGIKHALGALRPHGEEAPRIKQCQDLGVKIAQEHLRSIPSRVSISKELIEAVMTLQGNGKQKR